MAKGTWRTIILIFLCFSTAAILSGRLFYLQVLNHKFYQAQALGQQIGFKEVKGERGEIFFENSKEGKGAYGSGKIKSLAVNKEKWTAYAIPRNIKDKTAFAKAASKGIEETESEVLAKLEASETYAILKKDLPEEDMKALNELKLEGLYFEKYAVRYYPQEHLASQVIGFLGGDGAGQYGIEGYYEKTLKGKTGIKEKKTGFALIDDTKPMASLDGADLYLTIDYNIQFQAESLLAQAKKDINIDSGQIVVLKPDSGRVLALANFPSFNNNKYYKEKDMEIFQNSAVQKIFEPGSVFKPFTMAMALNEGKITADTVFTDAGSVTIGPDTLYNFDKKSYGKQTMSGILEKSINTGAVFVSQTIEHKTFLRYLDQLGFDEKTGIDVQGEVYSKNELLKKGSGFVFATASFGQGIEITSIQLARSFAIFANGGRVVKPYLVAKSAQESAETVTGPKFSEQVISKETALEVTKMLINVVERGFGDIARIPGYYLAGKTGTAEVPFKDKKGYYPDRTIQSFIGFGPALNPQFLILVKLDNPNVPRSALSAAPIFRKLANYIIDYWQIPPDYEVPVQATQ